MLLCHLQHLLKKKAVNTSYPDDYFSFVVNAKRQVCVLRLNRYLSKGGCPKQKSRYRETKSFSKCFFFRWFLGKKSDILRPRKSKIWKIERKKKKESSLWETYLPVPWSYRVLSHDVTAAILVSQNNETAAMLVSQTNPVGVEFLSRLSLQQQQENNQSEPKQLTRYL